MKSALLVLAAFPAQAFAGGSTLEAVKANLLLVVLGLGAPVAIGLAFAAAGRILPGFIAGKIGALLDAAKNEPWFRDPAHPKRAKALLTVFELIEDEVPDPGQGEEVYKAFGEWASSRAKVAGVSVGTASQWADLARKGGDAIDTKLDAELLDLANNQT